MIYSILDLGEFWLKLWNYIVPVSITVITVILFARITRGYTSFIDSIRLITSSWRTFFFFALFFIMVFWVYTKVSAIFGV
jgi:hypothetical protein